MTTLQDGSESMLLSGGRTLMAQSGAESLAHKDVRIPFFSVATAAEARSATVVAVINCKALAYG